MEKHGKYNDHKNLHHLWCSIKSRCYSKNSTAYPDYGGRGIKMCERWKNSFAAFLEDMGDRPAGKSIDRINNDGNYEPSNCRWATQSEQNSNQRRSHLLTLNGKTQTITEWAKELNMAAPSLRYRLAKWPLEKALSLNKMEGISLESRIAKGEA